MCLPRRLSTKPVLEKVQLRFQKQPSFQIFHFMLQSVIVQHPNELKSINPSVESHMVISHWAPLPWNPGRERTGLLSNSTYLGSQFYFSSHQLSLPCPPWFWFLSTSDSCLPSVFSVASLSVNLVMILGVGKKEYKVGE